MAERKTGSSGAKAPSKAKPKAKKPATAKKPSPASKSASKSAAAKKAAPAPNLQERMEGLQGWMAEIEKKQERTSRVGGVAVLLAILAAGGALALGVINKQDAATNDDIDQLTEQVNDLGASVEQQTEKQLKAINQRLATIQQQVDSLNTRQRQSESEITALQSQAGAAAANAAGGTGNQAGGGDKQP